MAFVFVSYSRKDVEFSTQLRQDLIANSINVWRDLEDIRAGSNWDTSIENALTGGHLSHFLVVLTPNATASDMVRNEIGMAVDHVPNVIPLLHKDCVTPIRIYRRQHIDFRAEYASALFELLREIEKTETRKEKVKQSITLLKPLKIPTSTQIDAAHDINPQVRLVAGPGTGKSFVLEERVRWLLANSVAAENIAVISFTRASSGDLQRRIVEFCEQHGQPDCSSVSVSTLHSLALRVLRKARLLGAFPVAPQVLDKWEMENIFDAEFCADLSNGTTLTRCEEIRLAYEAFWSTGDWNPPSYLEPKVPITTNEIKAFEAFLEPTTLTYACVLPGQIVKRCVDHIETGLLNPANILNIRQLIVDEYQDLNYTDTCFIESMIQRGVVTYVAGDDDQSIYAFRYAYPTGIQNFVSQHRAASSHELDKCFRCTPEVLETAKTLMSRFPSPDRIPKTLVSDYATSTPAVAGKTHRFTFKSEKRECKAIANSCKKLIDRGVKAQRILILISNRKALLPNVKKTNMPELHKAFQDVGVEIELSGLKPFIDSDEGRYVYTLLRIACDIKLMDYVAHRTLLGLGERVGTKTCNGIRRTVISNNLNYIDVFYLPLPNKVFSANQLKAIHQARSVCEQLKAWQATDLIADRMAHLGQLLAARFGDEGTSKLAQEIDDLPSEMTLKELLAYLTAHTDEQRSSLLSNVYNRLELEVPVEGFFSPKVRVMTMHGVKGLDADIVFIPGLEEGILPSQKNIRYPGLVLEAARLLYVSITRACVACIMSYTVSRFSQGKPQYNPPSRFANALRGRFTERDEGGLTDGEVEEIIDDLATIQEIRSSPSLSS